MHARFRIQAGSTSAVQIEGGGFYPRFYGIDNCYWLMIAVCAVNWMIILVCKLIVNLFFCWHIFITSCLCIWQAVCCVMIRCRRIGKVNYCETNANSSCPRLWLGVCYCWIHVNITQCQQNAKLLQRNSVTLHVVLIFWLIMIVCNIVVIIINNCDNRSGLTKTCAMT